MGFADSVLMLELQGPGVSLYSRFRYSIASSAVSDARWLPLLGLSGLDHPEHSIRPSPEGLATLNFSAWAAPVFANPAWEHLAHELLRIGFDPGELLSPARRSSEDTACAIAESLLWLSGHAALWKPVHPPPGPEVVSLGGAAGGTFATQGAGESRPIRFDDAATALGPSAVHSLSAIMARACGEPVSRSSHPATKPVSRRAAKAMGPAPARVEMAFLFALDPYRSLGPSERAAAVRDVLIPAVRDDFSYGVDDLSASAFARDVLVSGAPRI